MKVVEGSGAILGRLATFVAKEALKGEEVAVVNCKETIISGNKKFFEEQLRQRRGRVGTAQSGPKVSKLPHLLVKRAIRGMLPNYRYGRGRVAFSRIKCYAGVPKELENKKRIKMNEGFKGKKLKISEISK